MDFHARLKFLVEKLANGKHTSFAKKCGIPPSTMQTYITGTSIPKADHLEKLYSAYRINLNWLLVGEGEPFLDEEKPVGEEKKIELEKPAEVIYFDDATEILMEAENEMNVTLNDQQRQTVLKILRKELALARAKALVRAMKEEEEQD